MHTYIYTIASFTSTCTCTSLFSLKTCRMQYRQDAEKVYHHQMMEAIKGRRHFPPVRTFKQSLTSTNSVYHDIEMAEQWYDIHVFLIEKQTDM